MEQEQKRKPGRPSKGKRGNFTFRVTAGLRDQLTARAAASGLSVSEEIEGILEKWFNGTGVVADMLGGPHTARLMMTLAIAIQMIEVGTGKHWDRDEDTYLAVMAAMRGVLDQMGNPAPMPRPDDYKYYASLQRILDMRQMGETAASAAKTVLERRAATAPAEGHPDKKDQQS